MVELKEINNEKLEKRKSELIPDILDRILLICKEDENFKVSNELQNYDKIIESSRKKLKNKEHLIEQSKEIETKLLDELKDLNDEISEKRYNLLKELGSELDD